MTAPLEPQPSAEEDCAREPIHIIARTQAHGFLVALSEPDFIVRFASANLADALGVPIEAVLERSPEAVFGERQTRELRERLGDPDLVAANPLAVTLPGPGIYDCTAHRHAGMLLLEMEPQDGAHSLERLNVATHLQGPIARMEREADIDLLAFVAAREIRRISGFDRVIVYRFDFDWHGRVIAEATDDVPKYLGHHFPASDIPAQARRLFLINTLRTIVDVDARAVPVVPAIEPLSERPLDLSRSLLRSASPVHLQYLRNMGVRATMTVSILVHGKLWGMITAHHARPHRLDFMARAVCDLLGQILGAQIVARSDNALMQERLQSRERIETYMSAVDRTMPERSDDPFDAVRLMGILHADGIVARLDGTSYRFGSSVDPALLRPLIDTFHRSAQRGIASSNMLAALEPGAAAYAQDASGALYLGLSETFEDYIVLLRREFIETIVWAGDPTKAASSGGQLDPRTSFESWQQTLRGRSRPWSELELENARLLREQFMQLREAQQRRKAEERVRYLAHHDVLTGLPNRTSIQEKLERALGRAIRDRAGLAVLFVDLDHFKHFNDRLGHAAGDRVLQIVAARMRHGVRAEDTVGRLGGDEFIAILPGLETEGQALEAASRLLAEIERPFELGESEPVRVTASIGISRYPLDGGSSDLLLKNSDIAMYRVKEAGRNGCETFSSAG